MNDVLPEDVLPAWPGTRGAAIDALGGGTNNDSYAIECGTRRYLLRVYRTRSDPVRIHYEHELLNRLDAAGLSYSVPAPLPAGSGDTLVAVPGDRWAALFPFLPGVHPDSDDPVQLKVCGAALAELDAAMAGIKLRVPGGGLLAMGAFPVVHEAAPPVSEMLASLPLDDADRRRLRLILGSLEEIIPHLAASLPYQIVHRDFDASNVLLVDGRVSAVLDFEFARPDIRAIDLATGLAAFGGASWDMVEGGWRLAFAQGYLARLPLTEAEIMAIPDLMLLTRASSLLHRAARRQLGMASTGDVLARAQALLWRAEWLHRQGELLSGALLAP